jgi:hypothetical protein
MCKSVESVSSIGQFVEWVEDVLARFTKSDGYEAAWFRGVGDSAYPLIPGLYRTDQGQEDFSDAELRHEFARRALPLVAERAPRDDWEWYFLMQHFRAPTRLLDWTDAALVALYFAFTSASIGQEGGPRPAVWVLNPWTLNLKTEHFGPVGRGWEGIAEYLPPLSPSYTPRNRIPQYPIALDPTFTAQRMLVQHSHFTLHGSDPRSLNHMTTELGLNDALFQVVIEADDEYLDYMKQILNVLGITETAVFPDLEGLARELRFEYGLDRTRPKVS